MRPLLAERIMETDFARMETWEGNVGKGRKRYDLGVLYSPFALK